MSSVAIIGAGVVGVASACTLNRKGYEVTVFDPYFPGEGGSSKANAGHIGASDIFPLSTPGIHWKALKMLLDSDAPLKVPLKDFWPQIPWFWRFLQTSHGSRFQKATDAISFLGKNSLKDTKALLESYDLGGMVDYGGCAFIYDTKKSFNSSKKSWNERTKRGFSSESLNEESIAKITPTINNKFKHAFLSHEWGKVTEPVDIVKNLSNEAQKGGVVFYKNHVERISESLNSVLIEAENGSFQYDAVIIGGGGHGLATAYYLAKKHNMKNIAVVEKGWIGGGNTGRNTTIIRSNYLWDASAGLYDHALKIWEGLSQELNYNVMFSQRGVMNLAHNLQDVRDLKRRTHANRLNGIDAIYLNTEEIKKFCPIINTSPDIRYPVLGGTLQRRAGTARHDAVAWEKQ